MKLRSVHALIATGSLLFSLAACGSPQPSNQSSQQSAAVQTENASAEPSLDYRKYLSAEYPSLPADGPNISLTIAHAGAENSGQQVLMNALKHTLEEKSNGKISVTVYPNGQLGSDAEIITSCLKGDIDIAYQSGSTHSSQVPETQIFDTPFLFSGLSKDKVMSIITDSEFRDMYNAANEKAGLKCLMLRVWGSMNLTSNRPVSSLSDLQGLKIRTAQAESRMAVWSALGANPTPLAFSELYMALQNGTVDAQDNNLENAVVSGAAEVQKYLIPTQSMMPSLDVCMNKTKFDSMPAEYQKLLLQACKDLEKYDYDVTELDEKHFHDRLINEYHLTECSLTDETRAEMRKAAKPAIDTVKQAVHNDAMYDVLEKLIQ
ncbi:TRAP transporter substrate-binding protein [[Clostridium] aminophilum]|uniref:TRAP transporter substrate-binding protein n=1 Tax=[Clostridium] aminophilum TaxID=1526 RepID=UPI00331EAB16